MLETLSFHLFLVFIVTILGAGRWTLTWDDAMESSVEEQGLQPRVFS